MNSAKWIVAAVLLASPAFAQNAPSPQGQSKSLGAPGCGPANIQFDVKTEAARQTIPPPSPGKAMIVFLQDDEQYYPKPRPTTRFGVDGTWVGATHTDSYFFVEIKPGVHHLCASWQGSLFFINTTRPTAATHFTAESGETYYFRAKDMTTYEFIGDSSTEHSDVELQSLDGDEAQVLMALFELSTSHPKK